MLAMVIVTMLQAAPATAPTVPAKDGERKICRMENSTGSIMGRRICHTKAEWAKLTNAGAQDRDLFRDQSLNPGVPFNQGRGG